jgi:hypothetical protein
MFKVATLRQREEILKTLADGYLNFEQNAYRDAGQPSRLSFRDVRQTLRLVERVAKVLKPGT